MSEKIKDLCKSCAFAPDGCWIPLTLDGVTEGTSGNEEINIWVVKCEDHKEVKESTNDPN